MKLDISIQGKAFSADLAVAYDISIPIRQGTDNPNAFFAPPVDISPLKSGDFVGSLEAGSPVNFKNLKINPHGNGTHTESCAHIFKDGKPIGETASTSLLIAYLHSVLPERKPNGDKVIQVSALDDLSLSQADAFILRTLPNNAEKRLRQYSGTNPAYCEADLLYELKMRSIDHLLLDLPSVDREEDGGALDAHKAFWGIPEAPRLNATITELIYVPEHIRDGWYLLNLQVLNLMMDASPSRPILYPLKESF